MSDRFLRANKRAAAKLADEEFSISKKPKHSRDSPCPSLTDDNSKPEIIRDADKGEEDVTDIETERAAIIHANREFLAQLGLDADKVKLGICVARTPKKAISQNPRSWVREDIPVRRSPRLSGIKPTGFYIDSETNSAIRFAGPDGQEPAVDDFAAQAPSRMVPEVLTLSSSGTTDKYGSAFLNVLRGMSADAPSEDKVPEAAMDLAAVLSGLDIEKRGAVAKVVPGRIYSCAFHPSSAKVLAVAGDKEGNLGFWDVDASEGSSAFLYRPHTSVIGALQFAQGDSAKLWTWSYDCRVSCMDANKEEFRQMFVIDEDADGWLQHGFVSEADPSMMFVSTSRGMVMGVDTRKCGVEHRAAEFKVQAHDKKCNTVHACPADPHMLATAALDGSVKVWDLRKVGASIKPTSLVSFQYKRSINSAFFNATGSHLLAVTQNDTLCLFPRDCWATGREQKGEAVPTLLHHDNQTGRWLSTFHGVWSRRWPHAFLVGSMQHPRCLEVYSVAGRCRRIAVLGGASLSSVCSRNCWHPNLDILCGGNSSGRLHIFR